MDCGVAGIYLKKPLQEYPEGGAAWYMYQMLIALQHRGQQSAGMATFNPERVYSKLDVYKNLGLVAEIFLVSQPELFRRIMKNQASIAALGHVRYATSGMVNGDEEKWKEETQPFHRRHSNKRKHFAFVWNGNLANHKELRQELEASGEYQMDTPVDTEILMHELSLGIKNELEQKEHEDDVFNVQRMLEKTTRRFDGSYSLGLLDVAGNMLMVRDPHAFMPLCWGENEKFFAFASESKALNKIGIFEHAYVKGGHYVLIDGEHHIQQGQFAEPTPTPCFFQYIYFADKMSKLDGVKVRHFREKIGEKMAHLEPLRDKLDDSWVIVPVPETAIPIARKMSEILGINCLDDALIKDREIRTFIEKEDQRRGALATKYNIDPDGLREKHLLIIDDSVVRAHTAQILMQYIREAARPKSMHLRSACPPIISPCWYGVDFPTLTELIATKYTSNELERKLAESLHIESMKYNPLTVLYEVLEECGLGRACAACVSGDYPTPAGKKRLEELLSR